MDWKVTEGGKLLINGRDYTPAIPGTKTAAAIHTALKKLEQKLQEIAPGVQVAHIYLEPHMAVGMYMNGDLPMATLQASFDTPVGLALSLEVGGLRWPTTIVESLRGASFKFGLSGPIDVAQLVDQKDLVHFA